ncbi:MAG TPA: 16S rRNA (adenine(1518)-N(6)/adenine(1519)-N(6))-dimethyltransferase RsmA [Clostridiaceae bacterium]|nr:16S rRNA (adenine(1518)-N(6)/adenine(1519)-N(6))-dimethyltransferase RsmA [Clostridiaceae bacterium]
MNKSIKELVRKHNIRTSKSLGQNFLIDDTIVKRIVDSARISADDMVIEVGPGVGSMTVELAARAGRLIAVEIDRHLIPALTENLAGFNNVDIINEDILKINIDELIKAQTEKASGIFKPGNVKVVANLPYYITTPIIMKFLEESTSINLFVFMVQKEVADRILAQPGSKDYGALTVAVQYYCKPERVFDVPPHCFIPQPGVISTVVRLKAYEKPPVDVIDRKTFFKVVKASFGQRRKTLLNALYNSGYFNMNKEELKELLRNLDIDENRRGETLSIMQFAKLANSFSEKDC